MKEGGSPTNPPRGQEPVAFSRVVDLFASTLGKEKSEELITSSARSLGYSPEQLTLARTQEMLDLLGSQPGIVGVAARFARSRIQAAARASSSSRLKRAALSTPSPVPAKPAGAPSAVPASVTPSEIAALLEHTLGSEKSSEVVASAMQSLGIPDGALGRAEAVNVLEFIAKAQGIVGVVGRFAKARLILKFDVPK